MPPAYRMLDAPDRPVLVVEDLDDDFETVVEAADQAGVPNPLVRAGTLAEAEAAVASLPSRFGLVLLDVNLPDGSGVRLVRKLRQRDPSQAVPVVAFSTSANPRDLADLYAAGANAYHVKALRYRQNLATLTTVFDYWLSAVSLPDSPTA